MQHISNRSGAPPIECPLASLGRNTPSLQTHQVTYQHPLSTSPLNPQVYQMSRQSPLLNMGDNHLLYTPDTSRTSSSKEDDLPNSSNSSSAQLPSPKHKHQNIQPHPPSYRPPPLRNYAPIEAILAYHDRLSPVPERSNSIPSANYHRHSQPTQRIQHDHSRSRVDDVDGINRTDKDALARSNNDSYYPPDKLTMYGLPRNVPSERYFLEDQLDNLAPFNTSHQRHDDSSPSLFLRRASSPSETSGSDRYHTSRANRSSPAIHKRYMSHSSSTSGGGGGGGVGYGHSSLTRFSPSLDQGYATLVSPSPSSGGGMQTPGPWNRSNVCRSGPTFERLSDEAVLLVFQWMDSADLCTMSRVCRRFEVLAWRPVLWKQIQLKGEHIIGDKALKAIFRRLCGQTRNGTCSDVERVMLNDGCRMSDKGLQLISRRCPELTHLQVQNSPINNNTLFDLVTRCTNLQHLDITGCSQITTINFVSGFDPPRRLLLQYLDLTDCSAIGDDGLKIIVRNCPQLLYLYLRRCLKITDAGLRFVPSFCATLRELSVSDCSEITDFGLYELAKLGATLRYLSVAKCDQVSDAGLKVIARRCYKLRYLNARGCEAVSDDSIIVLAGSCPRLRALDIGKCDVSDAGLRALAESCPNLKKLSLKNCDMISDRGVHYISYFCRGLQQLNIQDCPVSIEGYRSVKRHCKRCVIEHTNPGFY